MLPYDRYWQRKRPVAQQQNSQSKAATHTRHARTPGSARLKKNTTTTPPDPTTPRPRWRSPGQLPNPRRPVLILPASLSCRHDSCRSFRRLPFSVGRGGHRLIRRQCGASIPHHTTSYNNHPSIQRQSVSHPSIHPPLSSRNSPVPSSPLGVRWASATPSVFQPPS